MRGGCVINSNITADYKIKYEENGHRYQFLCGLSGAVACTTKLFDTEISENELLEAWETEGRECFNKCHKCGKWVIDAMYNVDMLECVDCAPWQEEPLYCSNCGEAVDTCESICSKCGKPLFE